MTAPKTDHLKFADLPHPIPPTLPFSAPPAVEKSDDHENALLRRGGEGRARRLVEQVEGGLRSPLPGRRVGSWKRWKAWRSRAYGAR